MPFQHAAIIFLITMLTYIPAIGNDFVWWDDDYYVFNNSNIRTLDTAFIAWAFGGFHVGNWHPLTWLSHAIDYAIWELLPAGHHVTSILIHCVNTVIVFLLIHRMLHAVRSTDKHRLDRSAPHAHYEITGIAALSSLLFGIHPLHVESVAWVSERKDVLCAFFVLVGLLFYVLHIERQRSDPAPPHTRFPITRAYIISFGAFLLALMSKSMAVSLPIVMLLLDVYPYRRFDGASTAQRRAIMLEKVPFLLSSLTISMLTLIAQQGAMQPLNNVTLVERVLVAANAYIAYLGKLVWPVNLAHYHPYPTNASFSTPIYAVSLVLAIAIIAAVMHHRRSHPAVYLAIASYTVMLLPVLGIIQTGEQSMADRYTYLPSIGPFVLIGAGIAHLSGRLAVLISLNHHAHTTVFLSSAVICSVLILLTVKQIHVWKDDISLWTHTIDVYADQDPRKYFHMERLFHDRAAAYARAEKYELALIDLTTAINISPYTPELYRDRGFLYLVMGMRDQSKRDYDAALLLELKGRRK